MDGTKQTLPLFHGTFSGMQNDFGPRPAFRRNGVDIRVRRDHRYGERHAAARTCDDTHHHQKVLPISPARDDVLLPTLINH